MSTLARFCFTVVAPHCCFPESGPSQIFVQQVTSSRTSKTNGTAFRNATVIASAIGSGRRKRRGSGGASNGDGDGRKTPTSGQRRKWLPQTDSTEASEEQDRSQNGLQGSTELPFVDDSEVLYGDENGRQGEGSGDRELKALDREVAKAVSHFDAEEIMKAKRLVADLIRSGEDIEQEISRMGCQGLLNDAVLLVIRNRLKLARHEQEKELAQCLDLLSRRIEAEIEAQGASPSLRLLNDLLHLADELGADVSKQGEQKWRQEAMSALQGAFLPEDPFTIALPSRSQESAGVGVSETALLRIDFITEADTLLAEAQADMAAAAESILSQNSALAEYLIQELELPGHRMRKSGALGTNDIHEFVSRGNNDGVLEASPDGAGSSEIDADLVAIQLRFAERLRVMDRVQHIRDMAATLKL